MRAQATPPLSDAQRRAAFELLCIRGRSFEDAMACAGIARVIELCAHALRDAQAQIDAQTDPWRAARRRAAFELMGISSCATHGEH